MPPVACIWLLKYQGSLISPSNCQPPPTDMNTPGPPCVRGRNASDVSEMPVSGLPPVIGPVCVPAYMSVSVRASV
jgi:hypothetical protein